MKEFKFILLKGIISRVQKRYKLWELTITGGRSTSCRAARGPKHNTEPQCQTQFHMIRCCWNRIMAIWPLH